MVSREEYELATARGKLAQETEPRAVEAYYDRKSGRMVLELANRTGLMFSPKDAQGLEKATPKDLELVELCMGGRGLHFPTLDVDLLVPALVEGVFGSRRWMAARLGQVGGQAKSSAKAKSSRENGKLGGRPRKSGRNPVVSRTFHGGNAPLEAILSGRAVVNVAAKKAAPTMRKRAAKAAAKRKATTQKVAIPKKR